MVDLALMRSAHRARIGEVLARSVAHALRDVSQIVDRIELTGARHAEDAARAHAAACERLRQSLMAQVTVLEAFALADRNRVTPLSVADVVEVAASLARRAVGPTPTTIAVEVSRALPPAVGIAADISEACYAVLVNAVEALRIQGGGSIVVSATVIGDAIALRIADDGPGIPDILRESGLLFEAFPAPSASQHLRGIGLTVARHLVRSHGGDVRLEEGVGQGATFVIDLLLWRRSAAATARLAP